MLSPDSPASRVVLCVTLVALIALLVYRAVRKERKEYQRFKRFERTRNRQRMLRKWLIDALLTFGGSAVVILLLSWQYITPLRGATAAWPVGRWFSGLLDDTGALIPGLAAVFAIALVGGTALAVFLARNSENIPTIGDIGALLPRNRRELAYGAALSINAGVVEELLFRLAVPALIFGALGNAVVAVAASILLFALLHVYQGWPGMIGALVVGALLMSLYLATGNILVPIVTHALVDLRSLVLIPVLVYRVHATRA
ncbi:MAG: family intrarane metalloprotease protein [Microbacteriaceae bacterium]|nr:family intrarane metalloprotease protein [Microbacteriaceae bacterium]